MKKVFQFLILHLTIFILGVFAVENGLEFANQIANEFKIEILATEAGSENDLQWFRSYRHIAHDTDFVLKALAGQLLEENNNTTSFKENRALLARHVLEQFLKRFLVNDLQETVSFDLNDWQIRLFRILLEEEKYYYILKVIISFPKCWNNTFSSMPDDDFSGFFKFLKTLPETNLKMFYDTVYNYFDSFEKRIIYNESLKALIPFRYFLKEMAIINFDGLYVSFINKLDEIDGDYKKSELIKEMSKMLDFLVNNINFLINNTQNSFLPDLLGEMELHLEFIKSEPNVTISDFGIEIGEMSHETRHALLFDAIQFGRENLKNELLSLGSFQQRFFEMRLTKHYNERTRQRSPDILSVIFSTLNQVYQESDNIGYWNYNYAMFNILRLYSKIFKIEFSNSRTTAIIFVNDPLQVAKGVPKNFVYYHSGGLIQGAFVYDTFYMLKFETCDAINDYFNEIETKRPDILDYLKQVPVQINSENILLIMEHSELIHRITQLGIIFHVVFDSEHINKVTLNPRIRYLGDILSIHLNENIVMNFKNTALQLHNIEIITGKPIIELLLATLFKEGQGFLVVNENFYFKCRRVLSVLVDGPNKCRLRHLPYRILKRLLMIEYPFLQSILLLH